MQLANEANKYTFEVAVDANKKTAAAELSKLFDVTVEKTTVHNRLGKTYKFGKFRRKLGRRPGRKFMIFTLKSGDNIPAFNS